MCAPIYRRYLLVLLVLPDFFFIMICLSSSVLRWGHGGIWLVRLSFVCCSLRYCLFFIIRRWFVFDTYHYCDAFNSEALDFVCTLYIHLYIYIPGRCFMMRSPRADIASRFECTHVDAAYWQTDRGGTKVVLVSGYCCCCCCTRCRPRKYYIDDIDVRGVCSRYSTYAVGVD